MFQSCVLFLKTVDRIVNIGAKSKFGYNFSIFFPANILPSIRSQRRRKRDSLRLVQGWVVNDFGKFRFEEGGLVSRCLIFVLAMAFLKPSSLEKEPIWLQHHPIGVLSLIRCFWIKLKKRSFNGWLGNWPISLHHRRYRSEFSLPHTRLHVFSHSYYYFPPLYLNMTSRDFDSQRQLTPFLHSFFFFHIVVMSSLSILYFSHFIPPLLAFTKSLSHRKV